MICDSATWRCSAAWAEFGSAVEVVSDGSVRPFCVEHPTESCVIMAATAAIPTRLAVRKDIVALTCLTFTSPFVIVGLFVGFGLQSGRSSSQAYAARVTPQIRDKTSQILGRLELRLIVFLCFKHCKLQIWANRYSWIRNKNIDTCRTIDGRFLYVFALSATLTKLDVCYGF